MYKPDGGFTFTAEQTRDTMAPTHIKGHDVHDLQGRENLRLPQGGWA